jgi:hypothetical protein
MDFYKANSIIPPPSVISSDSIIPPDGQFYTNNALIKPPEMKKEDYQKRTYRYIIDSRDRKLKDNINSYTIHVNEDIHEVLNIQLIYHDFEFNEYNVGIYNNLIYIKTSDTDEATISIDPGVYDAESLMVELNAKLSAYNISVSYLDTQRKYKLSASTGVELNVVTHHPEKSSLPMYNQMLMDKKAELDTVSTNSERYIDLLEEINMLHEKIMAINTYEEDYKPNSIYRVLGFEREDISLSSGEHKILTYPLNLKPERYIVMYLQQAKKYNSTNMNIHQCFAIINDDKGQTYDQNIIKSFNPPLASYKNLKFKFCDYYGNPYDFQNKDHRFEIAITCLKQTRMYGNIFV